MVNKIGLFNTEKLSKTKYHRFFAIHKKYIKSEKIKRRLVKMAVKNQRINLTKHKIFITLFGCGLSKFAPGTVASIVTTLIWFFVTYNIFPDKTLLWISIFWLTITIISFFYGVFISPFYAESLKNEDPPSIVIDEFVGQLSALFISYYFVNKYITHIASIYLFVAIIHILVCLIFFRFLDIVKPSIIGTIDRNIKGGIGIMLDDLVSGILASILTVLLFRIIFISFII